MSMRSAAGLRHSSNCFGAASRTYSHRSVRRRLQVQASSGSMYLTLGIDCGTQGTKVLAYEPTSGEVVGRGSVAYGCCDSGGMAGRAEQDPNTWIAAVEDSIAQALEGLDASAVRALSVSGQQHGLVALDSRGHVLRPAKLWCDVESAAEAEELSQRWGTTIVPAITASKLLWLKRREPQHFAALRHVLLPHDFINHWLTGRYCMEAGDASGTGFWDPATRDWDEQRMRDVDPKLQGCFPKLVGPGDKVGTLRPDLAAHLGLPLHCIVAPGSGDNACSALGAGAVDEGTWVLSLGTSGTLFGPSSKPVLDPTGAICPFADATGQHLPLLCTLNCTGPVEDVRQAFNMSYEQITALAATERAQGVTFLPFLQGERTPNWPHASGALLGLRPGLLRPGLLLRVAMEGATFSLLAGLRRMESYGLNATELRVVGGGSRNKLWRRIVADTFQLSLRFPSEAESAALGAALQAAAVYEGVPVADYVRSNQPAMEGEVLEPSHEVREAYREGFERWQHYGSLLFAQGGTAV